MLSRKESINKSRRKKRTAKIKMTFLIVLLISAGFLVQGMQTTASSSGQVTKVVTNLAQLLTAINNANDGDVIGVRYLINIQTDIVVGDPNKHITLKRMDDVSYIQTSSGNNILFQNITFDGGEISSRYPFVVTNTNTTFENVTFKNAISTTSGGALSVNSGKAIIKNSTFENNRAMSGGHIVIKKPASIDIENSIFKNGYASITGGAIRNESSPSHSKITSSIITENEAGDYGGGVSNNGYLVINETKLYNNAARNGGSDIGNTVYGIINYPQIEVLTDLFKDDGIVPKGWIKDYDFEEGIYIPDVEPSFPNSLLKLDYEVLPTEVSLGNESLGIAGNGKITGLEAGKWYKVTVGGTTYFVKEDGTLTTNEEEAATLTGTEIIGLTNGLVYLVEEYTPVQEEQPIEESENPNEEEPGTDEEEPNNPNEPGTDEEQYDEEPNEEPNEPVDQEDNQDNEEPETPGEEQQDNEQDENKTGEKTKEEPNSPVYNNVDNSVDNSKQESNETTNDNSSYMTNSNNTSHTTNNNDSSYTVNNYSYDYSTHNQLESGKLPSNNATNGKNEQVPSSSNQTITIDTGRLTEGVLKDQGNSEGITINVNVNTDNEADKQAQEQMEEWKKEQQEVQIASANIAGTTEQMESGNSIPWIEFIKISLLLGIFIVLIRKRKTIKE